MSHVCYLLGFLFLLTTAACDGIILIVTVVVINDDDDVDGAVVMTKQYKSLPGSDKCITAPSSCCPSDQANHWTVSPSVGC